uniref:Nucleoporin Nup188 N-terminal subdomain III domain-containing protein n=1 Tax=Timema douglasi TaxID=61478 RepID=A0A7R8VSA5_TIMDO|nr:unnamed protein product [Timema douglasi]
MPDIDYMKSYFAFLKKSTAFRCYDSLLSNSDALDEVNRIVSAMDQKGAHGVIVMGWTFIKNIIADDDEQKTLAESNLENLYGNFDDVCLFLSQLLSNPIFQILHWEGTEIKPSVSFCLPGIGRVFSSSSDKEESCLRMFVKSQVRWSWEIEVEESCRGSEGWLERGDEDQLDNACGNVDAVGQWRNLVQSRMWRQLAKGTTLQGYSGSLLKTLSNKVKGTAAFMQSVKVLGPVEYKSKPILWDGVREGESSDVDSQPTKVSFRASKNRWIMKTVDGASYRTGLEPTELSSIAHDLIYKLLHWIIHHNIRDGLDSQPLYKCVTTALVHPEVKKHFWSENQDRGLHILFTEASRKFPVDFLSFSSLIEILSRDEHSIVSNISYGVQNLQPKTVANLTVSMKILANIVHSGFIVDGDMVLPVEAALDLMAKFTDVLEPPNQLLANCLDIVTYLWMDYRDEMYFKLDMIKFLPHVNSLNITPISCINGTFHCGGSLGPIVVVQEFSSAEYPLLKSFLQFVQVLLEFDPETVTKFEKFGNDYSDKLKYTIEKNFKLLLPALLYILFEVFPTYNNWRYKKDEDHSFISRSCLSIFHKLISIDTRKDIINYLTPGEVLHLMCFYNLLEGGAILPLLKLVGTGNGTLQLLMESQLNWDTGPGVDFINLVRLALALLNMTLRLKTTKAMDYLCPLEAKIMCYPNDKNHLRILHSTVDYIYHTFNPNLPTLAVELMRSFAMDLPVSLITCLGVDPEILRHCFIRHLESSEEPTHMKVAIFNFLNVPTHFEFTVQCMEVLLFIANSSLSSMFIDSYALMGVWLAALPPLTEVALRVSHSSLMSSDRMKPRSGDWAEVALRVSHSSLMSSDRMKPRSGDWAKSVITCINRLVAMLNNPSYVKDALENWVFYLNNFYSSITKSTQTHSHIKAFSSPTSPFTSPDIKWTSNLDKQLTPALLEIPHNLATSSALTSLNSPSLLVHVMMLLYWLLINSSNKNCHNLANVLVVLSSTAEDGEIKFYSVDAFILTSWSVVGWGHHQITNSAEFPANIYIFANLDGRFRFATHVQQTNERTHARLF